jgi:chitinase
MQHSWWRIASCLLSACLLAACVTTPATPAASTQPRIVGYVSDAKVLPPISAHKLDVINFAFATVTPAHDVVFPRPTAPASLRTLTALRSQNPALRIVLSIGGWGAGNFSEAALDADARARFARSAVALVQQHDLDGVDIDWEYPAHPGPGISHRPEDRQNFTLMLRAVRAQLDALSKTRQGRRYLLTIAAADGEAARGLELAKIAPLLDWINLMTYDFHGSGTRNTGHHAGVRQSASAPTGSRNAVRAVDAFIAAGVPARKLHLGLAFYGRRFGDVDPANDGLYQSYGSGGGYVNWSQIRRDYLADDGTGKDGYVRHWDAQAQSAWLWHAEERRLISYDDPQALRAKAAFVRERGLGGVMYWEQSTDPDEELLDVVRDALFAPSSTP